MASWILRGMAIGFATTAANLIGCSGGDTSSPGYFSSGATGFGGGSPAPPATAASTQPMLVEVDPNKTMTAQPGQGVGVFTEYGTGGHWHVWWTCDTNQSGQSCHFQVTVTAASGAIANALGEDLEAGDALSQPTPTEIDLVTQTSTERDGVRFDTSPGAVISLDAKLNGQDDGNLLFFVQDGAVDGNYTGTLTDPLLFEPASP